MQDRPRCYDVQIEAYDCRFDEFGKYWTTVYQVGRRQFEQMFNYSAIDGRCIGNGLCTYSVCNNYDEGSLYVIVSTATVCANLLSYVTLEKAFDTIQEATYYCGWCYTTLDYPRGGIWRDFEIWEICDDGELWHDWNLEADIYWNEVCYDNWLAEVSDGPHYFPTVVHEPELMSDDYLSSLKTANASGSEHCYYCGLPLSRPYKHAMEVNGTVELVCGSCLLAHSDQSLGDCFKQVLLGLEDC